MASPQNLVAVFEAITQNLERDRADLNQLDRDDNDSGDNMVANFQLVTSSLRQTVSQGGDQTDIGAALQQASQLLRSNGKGATAKIYAEGLDDASARLAGKSGFSLDDLMPLLEGLLGGAQRAQGSMGGGDGQGSLLDVLGPGVLSYLEGKRGGMSDSEAILNALLNLRRGAIGTARSPVGYGRAAGRDTSGEVDPGAAGAASLLEGLFGALLQSAMRSQGGARQAPAEAEAEAGGQIFPGGRGSQPKDAPAQQSSGNPILDILGSLFGKH